MRGGGCESSQPFSARHFSPILADTGERQAGSRAGVIVVVFANGEWGGRVGRPLCLEADVGKS
ncbi:hypothetical protein NQZ68_003563 [Dissostichus eleginoides]|nr:hypothetical protein NQZ68_003563 [Dissostichus eleginoides]